jgi:hypothetical protein
VTMLAQQMLLSDLVITGIKAVEALPGTHFAHRLPFSSTLNILSFTMTGATGRVHPLSVARGMDPPPQLPRAPS